MRVHPYFTWFTLIFMHTMHKSHRDAQRNAPTSVNVLTVRIEASSKTLRLHSLRISGSLRHTHRWLTVICHYDATWRILEHAEWIECEDDTAGDYFESLRHLFECHRCGPTVFFFKLFRFVSPSTYLIQRSRCRFADSLIRSFLNMIRMHVYISLWCKFWSVIWAAQQWDFECEYLSLHVFDLNGMKFIALIRSQKKCCVINSEPNVNRVIR